MSEPTVGDSGAGAPEKKKSGCSFGCALLIGMVLGVFAMEGVNKLMTQTPPGEENTFNIFVNPTLNLSVAVSATIVLVLAGLIAGYIPSRRAARLKTVDALRHNK